MDKLSSGKVEFIFSQEEFFLIHAIFREVYYGFNLDINEKKIIGDVQSGRLIHGEVIKIFTEDKTEYKINFTIDDIIIVRNSLIVVFIEFNKRNLYMTRMGCTIEECIMLLNRIDKEMSRWGK